MLISNSIYSSQTISNSNRHEVSEDYRNNDDQINQLLENPPSLRNNVKLREAVAETATSNKEKEIADSLLNSIDKSAIELETINGWTSGGVGMFTSALRLMFENISKDGIIGIEKEDLFQILLLDVMVHKDEYGLSGWYEANQTQITHLLESLGSGSHGLHEDDYDTPLELANTTAKVIESLFRSINLERISNTVAYDVIKLLNLNTYQGANELYKEIRDNYHRPDGWIIFNDSNEKAENLSPLLRLFILSKVLENEPTITQEELNEILIENISTIDNFIRDKFKYQVESEIENIPLSIDWLIKDTQWQIQPGEADKGGHGGQLDWFGDGIDISVLEQLYKNFPPRVLSDEDIKEINRIGDNVKMIMQTLKYWFQILRDERVAIARNI
ncbi:molecular chaperone [Vibrio cholerae]|uniref:molecular chaperone n=1 Tax=Vibrio cholerae TaxID=666 RepID=UPI0020D03641|nr:molecular chaperone [Vibrio cholerae]